MSLTWPVHIGRGRHSLRYLLTDVRRRRGGVVSSSKRKTGKEGDNSRAVHVSYPDGRRAEVTNAARWFKELYTVILATTLDVIRLVRRRRICVVIGSA